MTTTKDATFQRLSAMVQAQRPAISVVAVSSAESCDGKTEVACGLARAFAADGHRTVALDGGLARPALGKRLGVDERAPALAFGAAAYRWTGIERDLDVLQAADPVLFDASTRIRDLFARLRETYEYVVVDTSTLAEGGVQLLRHVDAVLLAVRLGRSASDADRDAVDTLDRIGAPLLGIVTTHAVRAAHAARKAAPARAGGGLGVFAKRVLRFPA